MAPLQCALDTSKIERTEIVINYVLDGNDRNKIIPSIV